MVGPGHFQCLDKEPGIHRDVGSIEPVRFAVTHIGNDDHDFGGAVDMESVDEGEELDQVFGRRVETAQDKSDLQGDRGIEVEGDLAIGKSAKTIVRQP